MDETKLAEMWADSFYSIRDIREECGLTIAELRAEVRRLSLPPRPRNADDRMTPEQMQRWDAIILERRAEIQARWTPSEEYQHRVVKGPGPYQIPCVQY